MPARRGRSSSSEFAHQVSSQAVGRAVPVSAFRKGPWTKEAAYQLHFHMSPVLIKKREKGPRAASGTVC